MCLHCLRWKYDAGRLSERNYSPGTPAAYTPPGTCRFKYSSPLFLNLWCPQVQIVHDRLNVEISQRLYPRLSFLSGRNYLSTGKERAPEAIVSWAEEALAASGFEEIIFIIIEHRGLRLFISLAYLSNGPFGKTSDRPFTPVYARRHSRGRIS